jgi:beta-lactamase regulating signal transducer with metallopeptidase domain
MNSSAIEWANGLAGHWARGMWPVLWQTAALAVIVGLIVLSARRASPALRFWLWMLVPLRLLVMPLIVISLPVLAPPRAIRPTPAAAPPPIVTEAPVEAQAPEWTPMPPPEPPSIVVERHVRATLWTWLMAGWLAGIGFFALRLARGWLQMRKIARSGVAIVGRALLPDNRFRATGRAGVPDLHTAVERDDENDDSRIRDCAREAAAMLGLRKLPRIMTAEEGVSPFVLGFFRPVVVLPAALADHVSAEELRAVLAHEFAHVRRRDALVGWILACSDVIYFFNPIVHLVKRAIILERERACDEQVLALAQAPRAVYARALLSATGLTRPAAARLSCAPVLLESSRHLERRLKSIAAEKRPSAALSRKAKFGLLAIMLLALPGITLTARSATTPVTPVLRYRSATFSLDAPNLPLGTVLYAIFEKDPVAGFKSRLLLIRKDDVFLAHTRADPGRGAVISSQWDFGFEKVNGSAVNFIRSGGSVGVYYPGTVGKQWLATRAVNINGKTLCWCIPFDAAESGVKLALTEENALDLASVFDEVVTGGSNPPAAPAKNDPGNAETMKQCDRNLGLIVKGIVTYQGQNNDNLPSSLADLVPKYLDDPKVLICPADKAPMKIKNGLLCSYRYIGNKLNWRDAGPGTIIAYDHAEHDGGRNVACLDGHTGHIFEEDFKKHLAQLYEQFKPLIAKFDFPADRNRVKAFYEDKDFPEEASPAAPAGSGASAPKSSTTPVAASGENRPAEPLAHPMPLLADEAKKVQAEIDKLPISASTGRMIQIDATLFTLTPEVERQVGLGSMKGPVILSSDKGKALQDLMTPASGVTAMEAPHVTVVSGRRLASCMVTSANYVSGYYEQAGIWVPALSEYEPSAILLDISAEAEGDKAVFSRLRAKAVTAALAAYNGSIHIPEIRKNADVLVYEPVVSTVCGFIDEAAAPLRLKRGEFLLIPATNSALRYFSNVRGLGDVALDARPRPPESVGSGVNSLIFVTATVLRMQEEEPAGSASPAPTEKQK